MLPVNVKSMIRIGIIPLDMPSRLALHPWYAIDRAATAIMPARLWLFDLRHVPEPLTPADENREPAQDRWPEACPRGRTRSVPLTTR